ncbi:MAG: hypothetical protein FWC71_12210 [Defluviitaleaceae bacterium]|nr:hypothetical protein [Defluviitaleaceae bacterium]
MPERSVATRFGEIYDATCKDVLAFITARCGRTADINDIFQDTYMELFNLLEKRGVAYVTHEKALVMRIAKQKIARNYSLVQRLMSFVSLPRVSDGEEAAPDDIDADLMMYGFCLEDFVVNDMMLDAAWSYIKAKPETVRKVFLSDVRRGFDHPGNRTVAVHWRI